jgi:acetyltransferase-like isoleucine patch superfamily enzyme
MLKNVPVRENEMQTINAATPLKIAGKTISAPKTGRVRELLNRALGCGEYCAVYVCGIVLGPSSVVRYLKNPNPRITVRVLRAFGATIGNQTTIKGGIVVDNVERDENSTGDFSHLKIGDNCYIGESVFLDLANEVLIEDEAVIAGHASFVTHAECRRSTYLSKKFPRKCEPVVVGRGAWVGFGATVLSGVTIGSNSVIGAHSLLLEDAKPGCAYVGNPARFLRRIE